MKKILLIMLTALMLTGCQNINDMDLKSVIDMSTDRKIEMYNQYRSGYKYHLPYGMKNMSYEGYNETLADEQYTYYLYMDAVSYFNKVITTYEKDTSVYYYETIDFEDKFGYIEIDKLENDKYLVEIVYNYAKIEVIVNEIDINHVVVNSINILSSVKYSDEILYNVIGNNILEFQETEFELEQPDNGEVYLDYEEHEETEEEVLEDPDLIK